MGSRAPTTAAMHRKSLYRFQSLADRPDLQNRHITNTRDLTADAPGTTCTWDSDVVTTTTGVVEPVVTTISSPSRPHHQSDTSARTIFETGIESIPLQRRHPTADQETGRQRLSHYRIPVGIRRCGTWSPWPGRSHSVSGVSLPKKSSPSSWFASNRDRNPTYVDWAGESDCSHSAVLD